MKVNNQLKACIFAVLCLSLPAALKADDTSTYSGGTASDTTTASQKSTAAGDTENINNNNTPNSAGAADNTAATASSSANQTSGAYNTPSDTSKSMSSGSSGMNSMSTEVTANNKASSIIGMEVRNNSDEKLGRIKDLVLDLQSGKVSYAVLDGGTVFKSKLFAIPLSAFSTSSDSRYLILNADKSKIETAQGFDKNSWPSVNNPDWGASTFLQDNPANSSNNGWEPEHRINNTKADGMGHMNAPTASPTSPNQ